MAPSSQSDGDSPTFPDGSITKIIFKDFMTYDHAILNAGPNLNLIVGTNGSGKSTIICGICLAVGGTTQMLGRSAKIPDFINHNKDTATVEVFIADKNKGAQSIKVKISRQEPILQYFYNDKPSKQSEIRKIATSYNIQIDNPCTFLAQDKVSGFARQSAVELLENTQKAGNPELLVQHKELIDRKKAAGKVEIESKETDDRIHHITGELVALVPRVENFRKKQAMETKLTSIEQKLTILNHEVTRKQHSNRKKKLLALKKEAAEAAEKLTAAQSEQASFEKNLNNVQASITGHEREYRIAREQITMQTKVDYYTSKIRDAEEQYSATKKEHQLYSKNVFTKEREVVGIQKKLAESEAAVEGYEAALVKIKEKHSQLNDDEDGLLEAERTLKREEGQLMDRKNKLRDNANRQGQVFEERWKILQSMRQGLADQAWLWYENNKEKFQHPVYVPVLHMTVSDRYAGKCLDNLIGVRDMVMFICGSKHDEQVLVKGGKWKLNTSVVDPNNIQLTQVNARLPDQLKELGFTQLAVELFSAPDPLKQYLCKVVNLHRVPIGTKETNRMYEQVVKTLANYSIGLFVADTQTCSIKVSRYSNETLSSNNVLRDARFLIKHTTPLPQSGQNELERREVDAKLNALKPRFDQLRQSKEQIDEKREAIRQERNSWQKKKELVGQVKHLLDTRKRGLKDLKENKPDLVQAKAALKETRARAVEDSLRCVERLVKKIDDARQLAVSISIAQATYNNLRKSQEETLDKIDRFRAAKREADEVLHTNEDEFAQNIDRKMTAAGRELLEKCKLRSTKESSFSAKEKATWDSLHQKFEADGVPDSLRDVENALREQRAKREIASKDGSQQDVDRAETLTKELEQLKVTSATQKESREKWKEVMLREIGDWRAPIEELVEAINQNYMAFFAEVGCRGEVHLDVPEDPLNIEDYGIMIMVSFRATERLKRLDHQTQSGGERSVSTMLYLLSLQELCPVPFRCVDEINQGMDATNERMVFDIMVRKLSGTGNLAKTQYFLLTPKLLQGLKYGEKVTVQSVVNGPLLSPGAHSWTADKFLAIMRANAAAQ